MYNVAMDVRKYKTYGIIETDGEIVKERYVLTSREEFNKFPEGIEEATVIVEASSTIDRIVSFLHGQKIRVANVYSYFLMTFYDFRRRVMPFQKERIEVFTDGNDDYTYVLKSFFPEDNINYGQLVKIRDSHGKLVRKERRIIYGDPDPESIDTVNMENFN